MGILEATMLLLEYNSLSVTHWLSVLTYSPETKINTWYVLVLVYVHTTFSTMIRRF